MRCDFEYIKAFVDKELDATEEEQVRGHIAQCSVCSGYFDEINALNSYQNLSMDVSLLYKLKQIPYLSKERFSLFSLLPRELALTAASVMFALYMGAFISTLTLTSYQDDLVAEQDVFEQINLAGLLDY